MVDQVTFVTGQTGPDAPTAPVDQASNVATTSAPVDAPTEDRPEWLPEQFATGADLAKAYGELRAEYSRRTAVPDAEAKVSATEPGGAEAQPVAESTGLDISAASAEFSENGTLSEKTYAALEAGGIPSDTVDAFIAGQSALAREAAREVHEMAGGEENYNRMTDWAAESWAVELQEQFDAALESGNPMLVRAAIQELQQSYEENQGREPSLLDGQTSPGVAANAVGFGSIHEQLAMQADPRYKKGDKAFHALFDRRLAATTLY